MAASNHLIEISEIAKDESHFIPEIVLNAQQEEAVQHQDCPLLILAGVGTGKTETLMRKYRNLLSKGVKPANILAVTFTNKAALEMKNRSEDLLSDEQGSHGWIGTFHSMSLRMLKKDLNYIHAGLQKDFHIIDTDEQIKYVKRVMKEDPEKVDIYTQILVKTKDKCLKTKKAIYEETAKVLSNFKEKLIKSSDPLPEGLSLKEEFVFENFYQPYQEMLRKFNLVDFSDLLLLMYDIFESVPSILEDFQKQFDYILLDEAQDLNKLQTSWLLKIIGKNNHFTCVGDDDQMIYGFTGASGDLITNFLTYFENGKIIKLEQNYRSTKNILSIANKLISNCSNRQKKILWTKNDEGEQVRCIGFRDEQEECKQIITQIQELIIQKVDPQQIAILTRTNKDPKPFEKYLINQQIEYEMHPKITKFMEKKEVKIALYFLTLLKCPNDNLAFYEVLLLMKGIGKLTALRLQTLASAKKISLFKQCESLFKVNGSDISSEEIKQSSNDQKSEEDIIQLLVELNIQDDKSSELKLKTSQTTMIKKLIDSINEYQECTEPEKLKDYLKQTCFYEFVEKYAERKGTNIEQMIQNVNFILKMIEQYDDLQDFFDYIALNGAKKHQKGVKILTMHTSKGLEFEYVFLPFWNDWSFPMIFPEDDYTKKVEEERRLAFVGITRAKKQVFLSYPKMRYFRHQKYSRFIKEILV